MKEEHFRTKLDNTIKQQNLIKKKYNQISTSRLISFFVCICGLLLWFVDKNFIGLIIGIIFAILFCILIYKHNKIYNKLKYIKSYKQILQNYISRFNNEWRNFENDGHEYFNKDFPQAEDLDLFGKNSLYQYICVAHTLYGKDSFSKSLISPNKSEISQRQQAIKELVNKEDFSLDIETLINMIEIDTNKQKDLKNFVEYTEKGVKALGTLWNIIACVLPLLNIILIILTALKFLNPILVIITLVMQYMLPFAKMSEFSSTLLPLYSFRNSIHAYKKVFESLDQQKFDSDYLNQLKSKFSDSSKGIFYLNFIVEMVNVRYNIIVYSLVRLFFMWDFLCYFALIHWIKVYGKHIGVWLQAVGEFENLLSFAVLCRVKQKYCFADIIQADKPIIKANLLFHPLIEQNKAVPNFIKLNANTCIITGSNMSGKTTFLRSIGINLILAYSGACTCADKFEVSCMDIFTSMRIKDDVSEGISTFYAEILRIKSMVLYSDLKKPMIVLIDEIFKGTNSADRIVGAKGIIEKLCKDWIITLVTTHDFELCDLENDKNINALNYHFEEYYKNDEIHFDYTIKNGRCKTTNAKQLMHMAGLI